MDGGWWMEMDGPDRNGWYGWKWMWRDVGQDARLQTSNIVPHWGIRPSPSPPPIANATTWPFSPPPPPPAPCLAAPTGPGLLWRDEAWCGAYGRPPLSSGVWLMYQQKSKKTKKYCDLDGPFFRPLYFFLGISSWFFSRVFCGVFHGFLCK